MNWGRSAGFAAFFGLGVAVGGVALRVTSTLPVNASEAQRRALDVLDEKPAPRSIPNSPLILAAKRVAPAVVNIDTVGALHKQGDDEIALPFDEEIRGKGSGVILTTDGYIVTNNHVIDGANRIRVTLADSRWYYAQLIGRDGDNDLAVIRIEAHGLPIALLGDSDSLQVGETSIAVGNPLGLGSTVTSGIISALNRRNLQVDEGHALDGVLQTDAAINKGNSGGALADVAGRVIGINTAILSSGPNGGSIGLGFAIPINTARRIVRDLIANGRPTVASSRHPWIGVELLAVPEDVAQMLRLSADRGALIRHVQPETPASLAGLRDNDIILTIDHRSIHGVGDVPHIITSHRSGDTIDMRILRPDDRRERDVEVTVQDRPQNVSLSR